jgi:hypothetical protein
MKKISYSGYRFPPEIIHQAIWLYLRFTLSLRDVEDLLAERGVAAARRRRSGRVRSGDSMVRIAITQAAYDAICATLPLESVGYENEANEKGERQIWA